MANYPQTEQFLSATVVLPVVNETHSLEETAQTILADVPDQLRELLIVTCDRTTDQSNHTIAQLRNRWPDLVVVHRQKLPFLGGAMREAFDRARGSHVIMMASDLETDPRVVKTLIAGAVADPSAIITASRWRAGGSFQGYSRVKLLCNWIFQQMFALLYGTRLTDMTYAFRIFPTRLVQAIAWEELRHPFLFESLVKPLRLGIPVVEVPAIWKARDEGESQNSFFRNFAYFRTGVKTRFASRRWLLKPQPAAAQVAGETLIHVTSGEQEMCS